MPTCHGYHIDGSYRVVHLRANAGLLLSHPTNTTRIILISPLTKHNNNITNITGSLAEGCINSPKGGSDSQDRYQEEEEEDEEEGYDTSYRQYRSEALEYVGLAEMNYTLQCPPESASTMRSSSIQARADQYMAMYAPEVLQRWGVDIHAHEHAQPKQNENEKGRGKGGIEKECEDWKPVFQSGAWTGHTGGVRVYIHPILV